MIQLLFSTNNALGSRVIRGFTDSDYSHVDIVCTHDQKIIGALAFKGVTEYTVADRIAHSTKHEFRMIDGSEALALAYAHGQIGKSYDWMGIFGLAFDDRDWQRDDKWFCSELVAKAALEAGNTRIPRHIFRITPGMLYQYTRPL